MYRSARTGWSLVGGERSREAPVTHGRGEMPQTARCSFQGVRRSNPLQIRWFAPGRALHGKEGSSLRVRQSASSEGPAGGVFAISWWTAATRSRRRATRGQRSRRGRQPSGGHGAACALVGKEKRRPSCAPLLLPDEAAGRRRSSPGCCDRGSGGDRLVRPLQALHRSACGSTTTAAPPAPFVACASPSAALASG